MHLDVAGTRLWFDVDGPALVPDGATMRPRPTLVLLHGGPGSYDHSYLKPWFGGLADVAQVVYLDLRGHGRSRRDEATGWSFERCADDVRAFCDAAGIVRPVVLGHSMGGFVAMLYGARHPGHAAGLVLLSTFARFDLERLVESFRTFGGDDVAELARRSYGGGDDVTDAEWARVYAKFGPAVPSAEVLARREQNPALAVIGMDQLRQHDVRDELRTGTSPTLVVVGDQDAVVPLSAADELVAAIPPSSARLEVLGGAGHFPWLDQPEPLHDLLAGFVAAVT